MCLMMGVDVMTNGGLFDFGFVVEFLFVLFLWCLFFIPLYLFQEAIREYFGSTWQQFALVTGCGAAVAAAIYFGMGSKS